MPKFRKKPVVIEAWEVTDITLSGASLMHKAYELPMWNVGSRNGKAGIIIPTLEGDHLAEVGDWIIKGVNGEFYPCKPDIFKKTYDIVTERSHMPTIRLEYEVPEDDCRDCKYCLIADYTWTPYCKILSNNVPLETRDNYTIKRCQPCIDAEVKEG